MNDLRLWFLLDRLDSRRSAHFPCRLRSGRGGNRSLGHRELDRALIDQLMVRSLQLEQDLMRPRWQGVENHGPSAQIGPDPGGVIESHMDVPDPGRHGKRGRPKHRHNVQIFRPILNHHPAMRQGFGQRRIDDDLRRWFVSKRLDSRCSTHVPGGLRSG
jgi:hypothetical protein